MKCNRCGADIPENSLRCVYCGEHVQMVPDYNPLGDVIEDEVRSAIRTNTEKIDLQDLSRPSGQTTRGNRPIQGTGRMNTGSRPSRSTGRMNAENRTNQRRYNENHPSTRRTVHDDYESEINEIETRKKKENEKRREKEKRREQERRRAQKRKQRNILLGIMGGVLILAIITMCVVYNNSYMGQMNKGEKAIAENETLQAIEHFENAISKDGTKAKAYIALASVYADMDDMEEAEQILIDAIALNPDNLELHEALVEFYIANDDLYAVNSFINSISDKDILSELERYESIAPEFSLEEGVYEDVQELTITSEEALIYYTLDGTEATVDSERYSGAIQIGEGTTIVRAISINGEDVPSDEIQAEYTVELPMESAPVVSPTTGQYTEEMEITVTVPSGYTAYYTLDNTTPTTDSQVYTGAIDMPEGNTIFTAILVNSSGKTSDVTKRNYDLVIKEEVEDDTVIE